jgi:hypothetical protein
LLVTVGAVAAYSMGGQEVGIIIDCYSMQNCDKYVPHK